MLLVPLLTLLLAGLPPGGIRLDPLPSVLKVDPPSWWPGHTINPVRLLVRGTNLHGAKVVSSRRELGVEGIRINERGTYLFVDLRIDPAASPGDAGLRLETAGGHGGCSLPPGASDPRRESTAGASGVNQDDVIYLIMTDRFCDGDPTNNVPPAPLPR